MQYNVPQMHHQKHYANTMRINTDVAPNKMTTITVFLDKIFPPTIPRLFLDRNQIPWHFHIIQLYQKSGHPEVGIPQLYKVGQWQNNKKEQTS